jgi:hypothetical protein
VLIDSEKELFDGLHWFWFPIRCLSHDVWAVEIGLYFFIFKDVFELLDILLIFRAIDFFICGKTTFFRPEEKCIDPIFTDPALLIWV